MHEGALISSHLHLRVEATTVDVPPEIPTARQASRHELLVWGIAAAALVFTTVAFSWGRIFYSDTWISLTSGRFIVRHGLPHTDTLSAAGYGRPWVDQQWLAHVVFYELWRAGGNPAVGAASALAFALTFGVLAALLVRRGSAPLATASALGAALVICLLFAETRAQSFAYPLFAVLLWILLDERTRPGDRRTLLVIPVLVLWTNVHGSVLLGIAVCMACLAVRGIGSIRAGAWRPAAVDAAYAIIAAGTLFATPYGTAMPAYYERVLGDPALRTIAEWQPASFAPLQLPFVLLLLGTLGLVCFARGCHARIPANVLVVGVVLSALATHAVRYQTWFALGVAPLLAVAFTHVRPNRRTRRPPRPILAVGGALLLAGIAVSSAALAQTPDSQFGRFVSQPAVRTAAAYAVVHPNAKILADDVTGSELLWKYPALAGRVGFDARTEVYRPADFLQFARFLTVSGRSWTATSRAYAVVAVTCSLHQNLCDALHHLGGWRVLQDGDGGVVAVRT